MTMVSSGPISLGGSATTGGLNQSVNIELGRSATASINMNESAVRTLFGKASGAISMSDGYGKSNTTVVTGGTLFSDATYYYRRFTATDTLGVSGPSIAYAAIIVAGGGGGHHGGGGAGGFLAISGTLAAGSYPVVIGAGGNVYSQGQNSSFNSSTAIGGGNWYAALFSGLTGGGSGFGGYFNNGGLSSGGAGTAGQGNNGGNVNTPNNFAGICAAGAGGGGAGAVGANSTNNFSNSTPGAGGAGTSAYSTWATATSSGVSGFYAGGGGGVAVRTTVAAGGSGGGGAGSANKISGTSCTTGGTNSPNAVAGTANTGGGGGGGNGDFNSANGGSGIVIVRYLRSAVGG